MTNSIKRVRYVSFNEEAAYAETPTGVPAIDLQIASAGLHSPRDPTIIFPGSIGRSPDTIAPGPYSPQGPVNFPMDAESIGWILKWALGEYKFTTGTVKTHEFYGSYYVDLPTSTWYIGKDVVEHQFTGCFINNLTLNAGKEFIMVTPDIISSRDIPDTLRVPEDLNLPTAPPFSFADITYEIDGAPLDSIVKSMTLTLNNNGNADAGTGHGSRYPQRVYANGRTLNYDVVTSLEDYEYLKLYWGGANGPDGLPTEFSFKVTIEITGVGKLVIFSPKCIMQAVPMEPSGTDEMEPTLSIKPLADTITLKSTATVKSEVLFTLENSVGEYVLPVPPTPP